jgi:hypothetical protein
MTTQNDAEKNPPSVVNLITGRMHRTEELVETIVAAAIEADREAGFIVEDATIDRAELRAWCGKVDLRVTDGQIALKALRLKLAHDRGRKIMAEGEQRGGDHGNQYIGKVEHPVTSALSQAQRQRRTRDRRIAEIAPADLDEYVQRERAAGREPSETGLLHEQRARRASPSSSKRATAHLGQPHVRFRSAQLKAHRRAESILMALDAVADGAHRSDAALRRAIRHHAPLEIESFLQAIRLIPWLTIMRDEVGTTFTIDDELRAICDSRAARPEVGFVGTVAQFAKHLRDEIKRKRKEANDAKRGRVWNSELVNTRALVNLLDWVEEQLTKLP